MTVHIGIVTYNSRADLPDCFSGIQSQTYSPLTAIIVDNASSDGSADWVAENVPEVTLIRNPQNVGFGKAHNQIIQSLDLNDNDYYLALNPDVVLQPSYIQAIVEAIQADRLVGLATGKLLFPKSDRLTKSHLYSVGHAVFRSGYAVNIGYQMVDLGQFDLSCEVFGAAGAAVIMKAELIRDLSPNRELYDGNLYDRDMFMYGEDVDVDWRARRRGWKCFYVSDAVAYHRGRMPDVHLRSQAILNRYLSVMKNADWFNLIVYNVPMIVLHCLFRIIFTPRQGIWMTWNLISLVPRKFRQRQPSSVPKREMQAWFKWAKEQPTNQPASLIQRVRDFLDKL